MRLSSRAHYAVRALLDLAAHGQEHPVPIQAIAKRQHISPAYLEQLFFKLRRGRVVRSVRGARGGYLLARPADRLTLWEIMRVVEEPMDLVSCLDNDGSCDFHDRCTTQKLWRRLGEHIRQFLDNLTLGELLREQNQLDDFEGTGPVPENGLEREKEDTVYELQ